MGEKLTDYATLRGAARMLGIPAGTVLAADLPRRQLADGTIVVAVADVRRILADRPKRGHPRKPRTTDVAPP